MTLRFLLTIFLAFGIGSTGLSQGKSAGGGEKAKPAGESCDGALDIVPSKPMTFTRKRRPTSGASKHSTKPAEKKQPSSR